MVPSLPALPMQQSAHPSGVHPSGAPQVAGQHRSGFQVGQQQRSADPLTSCLKWQQDGELSELDLNRILTLLSHVDPVAMTLIGERSQG